MTEDVQTVGSEDPWRPPPFQKNLTIRPCRCRQRPSGGIVGIKQVANYNWREEEETVGEMTGDSPIKVNVSSVSWIRSSQRRGRGAWQGGS